MAGVLFIVSGPSGVGKGTLVKLLLQKNPDLTLSVSCTTRQPRAGEREGREYFFIAKEEFLKRIGEKGFLEYDEHFGNYYGTPKDFVFQQLTSKSVILEIEVVGATKVRKALAEMPDAPRLVTIMVVPPDLNELEHRLAGRRSETEEERKNRMDRVQFELSQRETYDYVVVNDDLSAAEQRLQEIITNEIKATERKEA